MKKSLAPICLALVVAAGCKGTFVLMTIGSGTPAPPPVRHIDLQLMLGVKTATDSLMESSGSTISLPTSASIEITGGSGRLVATASGFASLPGPVAWASGAVDVASGSVTPLALMLIAGAPPDLGGLDGGVPMDFSVPKDMADPNCSLPASTHTECEPSCTYTRPSMSGGSATGCGANDCIFSIAGPPTCITCTAGKCDLTCTQRCTLVCAGAAPCTLQCPTGPKQTIPVGGSGGC